MTTPKKIFMAAFKRLLQPYIVFLVILPLNPLSHLENEILYKKLHQNDKNAQMLCLSVDVKSTAEL
jgi:hypothetical protein